MAERLTGSGQTKAPNRWAAEAQRVLPERDYELQYIGRYRKPRPRRQPGLELRLVGTCQLILLCPIVARNVMG